MNDVTATERGSMPPEDHIPSLLVRVAALCAAVVVVVYVAAVVVHVAPDSPATVRVRPITDKLLRPWFGQRWTLFAPVPPEANVRLYVQSRIPTASGFTYSEPILASDVFEARFKERPLTPSRAGRIAYNYGSLLARQGSAEAREALDAGIKPGSKIPKQLLRRFDKQRALFLKPLARYLSFVVDHDGSVLENGRPLDVRGLAVRTPIERFSKRNAKDESWRGTVPSASASADEGDGPQLVFDTGWVPYEPEVGS